MPIDPQSPFEVTALSWVPPLARGLVRDLRVRWALEEMGQPYRSRLSDWRTTSHEDRLADQPFGQVPAFAKGDVRMFESGAICLYLAEGSEALLPRDEPGRARAMSWVFAALNTIEPYITLVQFVTLFDADKLGAAEFTPTAQGRLRDKLTQLADVLGGRDWLDDRFTVADLLMVSTLRQLKRPGLLEPFANIAAYVARGEARPAFQAALAAQMDDFLPDEELPS